MSEPIHIMPIDDLLEHEYEDCSCLPVTKPVEEDDEGSIGWMVVHNAWDGRE